MPCSGMPRKSFWASELEHPMAPTEGGGGLRQPPVRVEQWRKGVEMGCLSNTTVSNQPHLVPSTRIPESTPILHLVTNPTSSRQPGYLSPPRPS